MPKNQPTTYTPFTKKFWKTLGISVLSTLLVYGGIVWATAYLDGCRVIDGGPIGLVCLNLGASGEVDDTREIEILPNNPAVGIKDHVPEQIGKTLKIINNHPTKKYFLPTRSKRELDSFLSAWQGHELKRANGEDNDILDVDICEVGVLYDPSGSFGTYGVKGCEYGESCNVSCDGSYTTEAGACTGIWQTTDWQPVYTGNSCASWIANGGTLTGDASCTNGAASGHFCQGNDSLYACEQVVTDHFCSDATTQSTCTAQNAVCTWNSNSTTHSCTDATTESACKGQNSGCSWNSCGYQWRASKWGTCNLGQRTRTVACTDADNNTVDESYCETLIKPATIEFCGGTDTGGGTGGAYWWQCYHNGEDGVYQKTTETCSTTLANTDKTNGDNCYLDAYAQRTDAICCLAADTPIVDYCGNSDTAPGGGSSSSGGSGGGGSTGDGSSSGGTSLDGGKGAL